MLRSLFRRLVEAALKAVLGFTLFNATATFAGTQSAPFDQALYLEVYINGQPTGLIANFILRPGERLAITVSELRELRIAPDRLPTNPEGIVDLDRCPGLSYRYEQVTQIVRIEVSNQARLPYMINAGVRPEAAPVDAETAPGAVLNYTLFGASNVDPSHFYLAYQKQANFSAAFEARAFNQYGIFLQSGILTTGSGVAPDSIRLDSTWSYSDQSSLITYRAGDVISGGLNWTRSLRLGGVQMQRNFALRPDLVTLPMPRFSGSAALPSTVDVLVNNVRTYSGTVPAGPFQIQNLPVMSGAGNQRIVVQDALGRETVVDQPFYASAKMLGAGLLDFSMETGFVRRDYGVTSNAYDNVPVASGSLRYGLNDRFTLEAHGEGGETLWNVGAGANLLLSSWGVASLAVAGSRNNSGVTGALLSASIELGRGGYTFYARTQRTTPDYLDLASLPSSTKLFGGLPSIATKPPRAIDQIGLNVPIPFDISSLTVSMTRMRDALDNRYEILGLSYSRPLPGNASMFMTAFKDFEDKRSFGVFGGITVSLGDGITASSSASRAANGTSGGVDVVKSQSVEPGSWGWRVRDYEGASLSRAGAVSYRSSFGRAEVGAQQVNGAVQTTAQLDGAVAFVGGGTFFTNRIDDAFAVVDAGAPNVDVFYENRPIATTGANGMVLVPYLRAYQKNWISVDPKNLAVDADVPKTKAAAMPSDRGAALVKFGISPDARSALVVLKDSRGSVVRAGSRAHIEDQIKDGGEDAVVGYGGEVYLRDLKDQNTLLVEQVEGPPCKASFAYQPKPGERVVISDVVCR
ncbi:MAG: fimbria/pilus outer membrane usher protein [Pseudomonadota bacterium]